MLFSRVMPRSFAGLAAEAAYNRSVTRHGQNDETALRDLVAAHIENYPAGIDSHHIRVCLAPFAATKTTTARPGEGASR